MFTLQHIKDLAVVAHSGQPFTLTDTGPLQGLDFVVKDLIDVQGNITACGNPDRLRDTAPALGSAPVVQAVMAQGARFIGKSHTDEVACGMFGNNEFFGTPVNPRAPLRVPGGSSSGSASMIAAGLCDFALGTDTGGSIRVPASFCGILGLRTTYGRLTTAGVMAMAPSFDSIGWFGRDASTLARVGEAYFGPIAAPKTPRLLLARDAFDVAMPHIADTLLPIAQSLDIASEVTLYPEGMAHWLDTFRPLQLGDLWATLGAWSQVEGRRVSASIAQRMELASSVTWDQIAPAMARREALCARMNDLLGDDGILVLPTAHELPPSRDVGLDAAISFRERTLALTCVASLCRLPQLNVPAGIVQGCPVGLSFIAGPRGDERLLAMAADLCASLPDARAQGLAA